MSCFVVRGPLVLSSPTDTPTPSSRNPGKDSPGRSPHVLIERLLEGWTDKNISFPAVH